MEKKLRIDWLDVAKAIGIFLIFLGHCCDKAGMAYSFVFSFHVPLFFFLSGCAENFNKEKKIGKNILNAIKKLLIPLLLFSVMSIFIYVIYKNVGLYDVANILMDLARGIIRNTFVAMSLWFLTCLFVIKCLFSILKKFDKKIVYILAAIITYLISYFILKPRAGYIPGYFWNFYNFDSAIGYFQFFVLGYILYPYIHKFLMSSSKKYIIIKSALTVALFVFALLCFFGKNLFVFVPNILLPIRAYLLILFIIMVAFILRKSTKLKELGTNTLYLCGSEYIVNILIRCFIGLFGFKIVFDYPLSAYIYVVIEILLANYLLVPFEKKLIKKFFDYFELYKK